MGQAFWPTAGLLPGVPERGNRLINWHYYFLTNSRGFARRVKTFGPVEEMHVSGNVIDTGIQCLNCVVTANVAALSLGEGFVIGGEYSAVTR